MMTLSACLRRLGLRVALAWLGGLLVAGCAGLNVKDAMPELKRPAQVPIDRTVSVAVVSGAEPVYGKLLDNENMREALVAALSASGRFRGVGTASGELELRTKVLSFGATKGRVLFVSMEVRHGLVAAYEIVEVASGRTLMRETVSTEAGSGASGGAAAIRESTTLALKENLRLLIEAIDEKRPGARP